MRRVALTGLRTGLVGFREIRGLFSVTASIPSARPGLIDCLNLLFYESGWSLESRSNSSACLNHMPRVDDTQRLGSADAFPLVIEATHLVRLSRMDRPISHHAWPPTQRNIPPKHLAQSDGVISHGGGFRCNRTLSPPRDPCCCGAPQRLER